MTQYLLAGAFAIGLLMGAVPTITYYSWLALKKENGELKESIKQGVKDVAIVTQYTDLINGLDSWYRANPVRVRIPVSKDCPGGANPDPESVILTVGRKQGSVSGPANP